MGKSMVNMRTLALTAAIVASLLGADAARAWEHYPGIASPGRAGIQIGDFNGDGKLEALVTGHTSPGYFDGWSPLQLLAVLNAGPAGRLDVRQVSLLPVDLIGPLVPAPRQGAADRLAAVAGGGADGQVVILGAVPPRILRTIEAPLLRKVAAIADVDADGSLEIVGLTGLTEWGDPYPVVLDYQTGAVKWLGNTVTTDVGVAQLDDDDALELIVAGTPGRIIDGASHAVEWVYPSGFGERILVGRFGYEANSGFAVLTPWPRQVQIFRGQPYSPVSQIDADEVEFVAVVRLTPDGPDQIALGGSRLSGNIDVYNPRTGEIIVSAENIGGMANAIAMGDLDGDDRAELVYAAGSTGGAVGILGAVDIGTHASEYLRRAEAGPYTSVARGDLQGDGGDQIVYLTGNSEYGRGGSALYVLDVASGQRLRARAEVFESWTGRLPRVAIARLRPAASPDIIIAGGDLYGGMVAVLDGASLGDCWRVGGYGSVFDYTPVSDLGIIDANGDGVSDVVALTSIGQMVVLDGRDGAILWQSVTLAGDGEPALSVFRSGAGTPRAAVARGAALYVFDLSTRLLVESIKTDRVITALWRWGEGAACRLAALDEADTLALHHCNTLASEGQRQMPPGTTFFRPLDAEANRFLGADGTRLYEVDAAGTAVSVSAVLGSRLGAGNQGVLRAYPNGRDFDLVIGSDYLVTRIRVGLEQIFADGFE